MKRTNKMLIAGLAVCLLTGTIMNKGYALPIGKQTVPQDGSVKSTINDETVVRLASKWTEIDRLIQRGGNYNEGEYKTFQYKGKTYRYLAKDIDTKEKLIRLLRTVLRSKGTEEFYKNSGVIVHEGKLAQLEADGGTLLNWNKVKVEHVSSSKGNHQYRLLVPLDETEEVHAFLAEFKLGGKEYKIEGVPIFEKVVDSVEVPTSSQVINLSAKWAAAESYILRGGEYLEGEYKEFLYKGNSYRYLASAIDSKEKLMNLLNETLSPKLAEEWYKSRNFIEYNGKLAQPNADGGSLLLWDKAIANHMKSVENTEYYRLAVPLGDTGNKNVYIVEQQHTNNGWKISKLPYLDLDIPGNINPAFQFINHLLINSDVSKEQFVNDSVLDVNKFKTGIRKIEFRELKEIARNQVQVEYRVKFYVELEKHYEGYLKNGENQMYFLIQQTDEMEYKIVSVRTGPHY